MNIGHTWIEEKHFMMDLPVVSLEFIEVVAQDRHLGLKQDNLSDSVLSLSSHS